MWFRSTRNARRPHAVRRATCRPRVEALEDRTTPSGGGLLDPTFGSGGVVSTAFFDGNQRAHTDGGVGALQADGKLIVAGSTIIDSSVNTAYIDLARYNPDGTPDKTFNKSGSVTVKYGSRLTVTGVVVDPAGKIVVAGEERIQGNGSWTSGGTQAVHLVRFNANGTLDKTFNGGTGDVLVSVPGYGRLTVNGIIQETVNNTPKFVVYGSVNATNTTAGDYAMMARFNLDGTLDTSFGSGGRVVTRILADTAGTRLEAAVARSDGSFLVTGASDYFVNPGVNNWTQGELVVARFTPNGTLDPTFGSGGSSVIRSGPTTDGMAITLQSDGKVVVGGFAQPDPQQYLDSLLARFNPDGSPDATFAGGGYFTVDLDTPSNNDRITEVAVQPDGKIVAWGYSESAPGSVLLRFSPAGTPDASFGTAGRAADPLGSPWGKSLFLQADGRIVTTGTLAGNRIGAARFLASAPQVGSFTAAPNPVAAGDSLTLTAGNITNGNPGATVTKVEFYAVDASGVATLLGSGTKNADGTWTLSFTTSLAPGSYTLLAVATDSYGATGDPFSLDLDVQ